MKKTEYFTYRNNGSLAPEQGIEHVTILRDEFIYSIKESILEIENESIQFVVFSNSVTTILSLTYITA